MTKLEQQIDSLEKSILKWKGIVDGKSRDDGPINCECCIVYRHSSYSRINCIGCPIAEDTGLNGCRGTPYPDWWGYFDILSDRYVIDSDSMDLAQAELDYLKDLLLRLKSDKVSEAD